MTRLLIADDHPFVLSGIEVGLAGTDYEVIASATDGLNLLDMLASARPDILVMDVQMPGLDGVDVLRTLRARGDLRPVVLLTAGLEDRPLLEAMQLGVNGIVLKDGGPKVLIKCLDAVRGGGKWIEQSLLQRVVDLTMDGGPTKDPFGSLKARERAIVGLIARGMRNREVADELGMTEGTVKVYLSRIYGKLGVSSRTELAIYTKDKRPG